MSTPCCPLSHSFPLTRCALDEPYEALKNAGYFGLHTSVQAATYGFREKDDGSEIIVLIDIFATDITFGYSFNVMRKLESLNGVKVESMAHLYNLYQEACELVCAGDHGGENGSSGKKRAKQTGHSRKSAPIPTNAELLAAADAPESASFLKFSFSMTHYSLSYDIVLEVSTQHLFPDCYSLSPNSDT